MTQPDMPNDFNALWQRLAVMWADSERVWNDAVRQDFEKRYMMPLQEETLATMKEMAKLLEVIAKAQRNMK